MSAAVKKLDVFELNQILDKVELSEKSFQVLATKMYELAGVNLPYTAKNISLVKNRIAKLLRKHSLTSYEDYIKLLSQETPELINEFISALTTNKTNFFRESAHFDFFNEYLKTHFNSNKDLRVWCAASSTGQEPYTIAMCIKEAHPGISFNKAKLLSTDIDLDVLDKATRGVYKEQEMDGVPQNLRQKYFDKKTMGTENFYRAKDDLIDICRFARFNLIQGPYNFEHKFHVIFCRNVLIYFDEPTTKAVIQNLVNCLVPGGFLILGHSESGTVRNPDIKAMTRAVFKKVGSNGQN